MNKLSVIWTNRQAYVRRYLWPLPRFRREAVVMVDGKMNHGGLTDRLRHILSVYSYCKEKHIRFRVYYIYPRPLTDYLLPAEYDWRISRKDISYHILDSYEIGLYVKDLPETGNRKSENAWEYKSREHINTLNKSFEKHRRAQFHVYGNAYFAKGNYKALFGELFRPSAFLENKLSQVMQGFDEPYESVTLRFQMLLGDFYEGDFEVLDEKGQEELIDRCCNKIDEMWKGHYFSASKVLVTSDSLRFLSRVAGKEYVYTIPGRMEHMDHTHNTDIDMNAKSFVDLYMLMRSQRLTQLITGKMYKSGFPVFAAELGGRPYEEVVF